MELKVEFEREEDGRWIAEVTSIPGAMAYGSTKNEAGAKAEAILCAPYPTALKRTRRPWN